VGEIEDEFDPHTRELIRPDGDALRIDGSAPLRLVAERLGATIDAPHEATIGGHLTDELGRVPEPGEVVHLDGVALEVVEVDDTRITALRHPPQDQKPGAPT